MTVPLEPTRPRRRAKLSSGVVDDLCAAIRGGDLPPGAQLPTEGVLCARFGVSRTVVREAISTLAADGLVMPQQGRGVFVADDLARQPFRLDQSGLDEARHVAQMMELRLSLEVESARLAAVRRSNADLDALRAADAAHLAAARAGEVGKREDFALHVAIARASGNRYVADFLAFLGPFIIPSPAMRHVTGLARAVYQDGLAAEHSAIIDAIEAREAEAASTAMRDHLLRGLELNRRLLAEDGDAP